MKFLVYGAGTIGITYAWLLSAKHDAAVFVRPEKIPSVQDGYSLTVHDLRKRPNRRLQIDFRPALVTDISGDYDAILVTVNRCQLKSVLPALRDSKADILFMQNNWDIQKDVSPYLNAGRYILGFPAQVGGGREGNAVEVNLYRQGTVLGEADGRKSERLAKYKQAFEQAGLAVKIKKNIPDWLKVHYLQQSVSAGAILKAGGYEAFANSRAAVKEMARAFREGIAVCAACGVNTKAVFPVNMFRMPVPIVSLAMKGMLNKPDVVFMVTGHMKQGLKEWVAGYYEVLESGLGKGVPMPVWQSYKPYVDACVCGAGKDAPLFPLGR